MDPYDTTSAIMNVLERNVNSGEGDTHTHFSNARKALKKVVEHTHRVPNPSVDVSADEMFAYGKSR